jgi:hypothetical protein
MVDAADLKSASLYRECGFESLPGHQFSLDGDRRFLRVLPLEANRLRRLERVRAGAQDVVFSIHHKG